MEIELYSLSCQRAFQKGLALARRLRHPILEIEHIGINLLDSPALVPVEGDRISIKRELESFLVALPKIVGSTKVEFGNRLDSALDQVESRPNKDLIEEKELWDVLVKFSTVLKNSIIRRREGVVEATWENVGKDGSPQSKVPIDSKEKVEIPLAKNPAQESDVGDNDITQLLEKISAFTHNLSKDAELGKIDPVFGRDGEIRRIIEILGRKKKNNPVLLGEPGVGKTAIAELLALRIKENRVPATMKGRIVVSLDFGALLAGAKYRGDFENRLKELVEVLQKSRGRMVLFIDEIHLLIGAGNPSGPQDAANLLKPALARGEFLCIGATTLEEYRKYIVPERALERRFQPLVVEEPNPVQALAVLRGIKHRYEIHHGVSIADEALQAAVELTERYVHDRQLPDKAIDVIDEAASRLRVEIESMPAELDQLKSRIEELEIERKTLGADLSEKASAAQAIINVRLGKAKKEFEELIGPWKDFRELVDRLQLIERQREELLRHFEECKQSGDFTKAAEIQHGQEPILSREIETINKRLSVLQQESHIHRRVVGPREVAEIVADWSRIPLAKLEETEIAKIRTLESRLLDRVLGQEAAVNRVSRALRRAWSGISDPKRPLGILMFTGPTGVGKTEMAKALATELYGTDEALIRFDMSEYSQPHQVARLIGAPPGYVGYGVGGELTEAVRTKPYSVILFDEIEKADERILDILLQVLEDGRLTDGLGKTASFRNSIIILTSNLLVEGESDKFDGDLRGKLSESLRPELVNRIDDVVKFRALNFPELSVVLDKFGHELNYRLTEKKLRIGIGNNLKKWLIEQSGHEKFGGRALRRIFQSKVVDVVAERLLSLPPLAPGSWILDLDRFGRVAWEIEVGTNRLLPPAQNTKIVS